VNIALALFVFMRNRRKPANRAFAAAVFTIVLWLALAFLCDQPDFVQWALVLNRMTLASAIAMGAFLLYFALVFGDDSGPLPTGWWLFLFGGGILALVTASTPLVVANVQYMSWGTNIVSGPLLWFMAAWTIAGVAAIVFVLLSKVRRADGREGSQLKYILLGLALFLVSSATIGLIVPMLTGSYEYSYLNTHPCSSSASRPTPWSSTGSSIYGWS
jgi:hypothetical protein